MIPRTQKALDYVEARLGYRLEPHEPCVIVPLDQRRDQLLSVTGGMQLPGPIARLVASYDHDADDMRDLHALWATIVGTSRAEWHDDPRHGHVFRHRAYKVWATAAFLIHCSRGHWTREDVVKVARCAWWSSGVAANKTYIFRAFLCGPQRPAGEPNE